MLSQGVGCLEQTPAKPWLPSTSSPVFHREGLILALLQPSGPFPFQSLASAHPKPTWCLLEALRACHREKEDPGNDLGRSLMQEIKHLPHRDINNRRGDCEQRRHTHTPCCPHSHITPWLGFAGELCTVTQVARALYRTRFAAGTE